MTDTELRSPRRWKAVVWSVSTGPVPIVEYLFLKGDEDPDHMVAIVELDTGATDYEGRWRASRALLESATVEQIADIKSRARPIDRVALGFPGR